MNYKLTIRPIRSLYIIILTVLVFLNFGWGAAGLMVLSHIDVVLRKTVADPLTGFIKEKP